VDHDQVSVSNLEGMRALTEHVIVQHGVTDPVYVAGLGGSPDDAERYEGFVQALTAVGIDAAFLPVLRGGFSREKARAVAERLLAAGPLPGADVRK
jgi:LacI family transcriptional regulator